MVEACLREGALAAGMSGSGSAVFGLFPEAVASRAVRLGDVCLDVTALAAGRRPDEMADDEAILYDVITELQRNHAVSDATYARALAKFGEAGIVEATSLSGYYAMLAMVMNTARTPLPPGAKPPLAPFPY